ncbi:TetR/AcrR family transcriptional regulator [Acidisoma cellulosilytica]|uniref:TetR/AcrR family transcriptional regulator n=1 Tax=Acidisoma cellulosilyticum TaxID=2802395 RepID=A0A963Z032_9PROT|nr:TetR/AcrR family transcriptional regulator [Acidisoma cellulosilyticum]MCB8879537.1 TetR/AcrR family transcriptional regulator [Acidisoma cellulosilyticum]
MAPKAETHRLILEKAKELFSRFGPHRTTVADIARELHMSPANVYKFFQTKDALVEAVGEHFMRELHLQLLPIIRAEQKPAWIRIEDVIRAVNRHFIDMIETNVSQHGAQFFQNVIEFTIIKREKRWRFVGEFLHCTLRLELANLLREGVEKDGLRVDDASMTATALLDCLACSIEPLMLIGIAAEAAEERLERQLRLLARAVS